MLHMYFPQCHHPNSGSKPDFIGINLHTLTLISLTTFLIVNAVNYTSVKLDELSGKFAKFLPSVRSNDVKNPVSDTLILPTTRFKL